MGFKLDFPATQTLVSNMAVQHISKAQTALSCQIKLLSTPVPAQRRMLP
jgi:hypothetical protein